MWDDPDTVGLNGSLGGFYRGILDILAYVLVGINGFMIYCLSSFSWGFLFYLRSLPGSCCERDCGMQFYDWSCVKVFGLLASFRWRSVGIRDRLQRYQT